MSPYEKLMEELGVLAKAQADAAVDGDQKIQQAAGADGDAGAGGGADDGAGDAAAAAAAEADAAAAAATDAGEGKGKGDGDGGEPMGKSLSFTLEDGTVVEAVDGTELVKALLVRTENNEANFAKALGTTVELIKSLQGQVGSMKEQLEKISTEGRGRKAVVSVAERPTVLTKSQPEDQGITPTEFMAKALTAQAAGKITGSDVARAEAYLNRGLAVPAEIVARVAAQ